MEYRQIVSVTGLGGLYQLISTKNDGAILRSLADQSVKFISARIHQITPLESIEIYTYNENARLHEVLEGISRNDEAYEKLNVAKADSNTLRSFFREALPAFDEDRVYVSDIRKILKWYSVLKANDLLNFEAYHEQENPEADTTATENTEATVVTSEEASEKKKENAPKKAAKKAVANETADTEKPAKKTNTKKAAVKKATESAEEDNVKKATAKKEAE